MKNNHTCVRTMTCGLCWVLTLAYPKLLGTKRDFVVVVIGHRCDLQYGILGNKKYIVIK